GRGGRDIDRPRAVAARADDVDDERKVVLHAQRALAHRAGSTDDFVDFFAFRGQRYEQGSGLDALDRLVHESAYRHRRLFRGQVVAGDHSPQQCRKLSHRAGTLARSATAKKFEKMVLPSGVNTDSGWNCTAKMGRSRCAIPCTTPSSLVAVTGNSEGNEAAEMQSE